MHTNHIPWLPLILVLVLGVVLTACSAQKATPVPSQTQAPAAQSPGPTEMPVQPEAPSEPIGESGGIDCMGTKSGDTISIVYPWSGSEEDKLDEILKPLVDACGIVLKAESVPDQASLDSSEQAGTPPDMAIGKVVQLAQYKTLLKPVTDLGVQPENYADYWQSIGTVDGSWLGLPVRADLKTIIWYSPANFEAFGYQVPTSVHAFITNLDNMASDGHVPWSMGLEAGDLTGKAGADTIEDIVLSEDGPLYLNGIIEGQVSYDGRGVANAYRVFASWATDPKYTVGGAQGALSANSKDAIYKVFSDPPEAMMARQSGIAGAVIAARYPNLEYGTDYDFFQIPGTSNLHGHTDWLMAFSDSAAVRAMVAYLSSEQGGKKWAQVGLGITPNSAGTDAYTDEILKKQAQLLANAGTFVPDLSEAIGGGFASAERKAIVDLVNGAAVNSVLKDVAAAQTQALGN